LASIDSAIYYVMVLPQDDPYITSFFQGFSTGWFALKTAMDCLVDLPTDTLEPGLPHRADLNRRIAGTGGWRWLPINMQAIQQLEISAAHPFWIVFCGEKEVAEVVSNWARKQLVSPLIITPVAFDSAVTMEQLNWAVIRLHVRNALDQAYQVDNEIDGTIVEDALRKWQVRPHTPAPFPARGHNCLTPNQLVLRGAGFTFEGGEPFMPPTEADYIKAIIETARAVKGLREDLGEVPAFRTSPPQPGLFLTSPSLYRHIYDRSPPTPTEFRDPQIFRETFKILQRQKGFQFHIAGDKGQRIMRSEARAILHMRAEETAVHSLAVGLRAASTLAATLRLPPAVNTTAGAIRQLSTHTRAAKAHNRKFGEIFATVQKKLLEAVGPDLVEEIKHYSGDIKLITDVPLEWLPIDGFPLSLLFYTSRITATPGNLMISELATPTIMRFRTEAFREILILRSFDETDAIREYLPQALSVLEPRWKDELTIRSVEISSVDEFVRAIDAYTGPIMIFDGHGGHGLHDAGTLKIGKSDVDVWELRTRVRVRPLLFSALAIHMRQIDPMPLQLTGFSRWVRGQCLRRCYR